MCSVGIVVTPVLEFDLVSIESTFIWLRLAVVPARIVGSAVSTRRYAMGLDGARRLFRDVVSIQTLARNSTFGVLLRFGPILNLLFWLHFLRGFAIRFLIVFSILGARAESTQTNKH